MRIFIVAAVFASVWGIAAWILSANLWERLKFPSKGSSLPWRRYFEARRHGRFASQLVNALDMLSGALKSGQSLTQALQSAGTELASPSGEYFQALASKVGLGTLPEDALDEFAASFGGHALAEDIRMLSTAVAVTRTTGGNLSEILARLSETLRERQRLRFEIDALTAQGKMSGFIVGGLPAFILAALWVLDPDLVRPLFTTGTGWAILAVAVAMESIGAFLISRIVAIEA